jgi:hypothetical protein
VGVKTTRAKGTRIGLAGILAAGALVVPSSLGLAPAVACSDSAPGPQRTLEVQAKALNKVVKRGKVVKIEVKTYRPAQEDFAGTGTTMPPGVPLQPAGDVPFTLGVLTGGGYVYQNIASKTNADGTQLVKMKLERYHKPGPADIRVRAFVDHSPSTSSSCVEIQEYGYSEVKNAFKVT